MVKVLTKFWEKQFGYLLHPLPLTLKWDKIKLRGISTYHKPILVKWFVEGELILSQEIKKWHLIGGPYVKCDEIQEFSLENSIPYPFD
tara:strand:- start:279 stop:542 length:264 start_codon:yes stop_codon:yes gene_type:complete